METTKVLLITSVAKEEVFMNTRILAIATMAITSLSLIMSQVAYSDDATSTNPPKDVKLHMDINQNTSPSNAMDNTNSMRSNDPMMKQNADNSKMMHNDSMMQNNSMTPKTDQSIPSR